MSAQGPGGSWLGWPPGNSHRIQSLAQAPAHNPVSAATGGALLELGHSLLLPVTNPGAGAWKSLSGSFPRLLEKPE